MLKKFTLPLLVFICLSVTCNYVFSQDIPAQTALIPSPRKAFTPTPQSVRGYWNIDVVDDFTLPKSKHLTFSGAGRNLHVKDSWDKLFRRGFSAIERSRMTDDELGYSPLANAKYDRGSKFTQSSTWTSRLLPEQRSLILYQNYFTDLPFNLPWARNSDLAKDTYFLRPPGSINERESLGQAMSELSGGCVGFGDCPPSGQVSTFGKIFFDIENEGTSPGNEQEHANLYVYKMWMLRQRISPYTEIGGIGPVPHNSYGYSRSSDFANISSPDWLWRMPAKQIDATNTRGRGMPDAIVGKTFGELAHFQMPGTYFLSSDFDYAARHNGDEDRHWLASVLGEQEVNMKLSPKKRIAWQWLFNTQSSEPGQAARAEYPAPPAIAEGMAIFYWFTGAHGAILWDDWNILTPNAPVVPGRENLDNDRNYSVYEHYLHGLWRLFKHHGDLFNGQEIYLNEATECSYDNGKTWYRLNSNAQKRSGKPFARAIVNGSQILIAATQPYASASQETQMMVRYVQGNYRFYTTINLKGDEIFLGRATMPTGTSSFSPALTTMDPPAPKPLAATVSTYNCSTGAIVFGFTGGSTTSPVEYKALGITDWTTNANQVIEAGLRADPKTITIYIRQNGVEGAPYNFDMKAYCSGNPLPPANTAPVVAKALSPESGTVGVGYSLNLSTVFTDAETPTGLVLSVAGLPAGLQFSGGTISGTPSVSGVSTITVTATDPGNLSAQTTFALTINPASAPTPTPPPPITGGPLGATVVTYNCSTGAIMFGFTGGNGSTVEYAAIGITGWTTNPSHILDAGLRSDPKTISVMVRQGGVQGLSFSFDMKAYCSAPQPVTNTAPTVVNLVGPQSATVGTAYSLNIGSVFTDAQTPGNLTLSAAGLPAGLTLTGTAITGTPSASGVSTIMLKATDPGNLTTATSFQLTVSPVPSVTVVTNTAPTIANLVGAQTATVGTAYSLNVGNVFTDAQTPNSLTLSTLGLPTGLTLNGSLITGTPSTSGVSNVALIATDPGSLSTVTLFVLTVNPAPSVTVVTNTAPTVVNLIGAQTGTVGTAYSLNIGSVFTDAQTPGSLTLSAMGLPAGLTLTGTAITGTPSATGVSTITLKATDPGNLTAATSFQLTVRLGNTPPVVVNPVGPQSGTTGVSYSLNVSAIFTDAETPTQLLMSISGLPAGLQLSGSNLVGTPTVAGSSTMIITVTDPGGLSTTFRIPITIVQGNTRPVIANLVSPQTATQGVSYTLNVGSVFTDMETPNSLTLSAVGLPAGLTLTGTTITGTPSVTGQSSVALVATDPGSLTTATIFLLTVNAPVSTTGCGSPANTIGQTLRIMGVTDVNCQTGTFRISTRGGNGTTIFYDNNVGLKNTDPTNCLRILDNPDMVKAINNPNSDIGAFQLKVRQGNVTSNTFTFNFKQYCTGAGATSRMAYESPGDLTVLVLGNPTPDEWARLEIQSVGNEPLSLQVLNVQGQVLSIRHVEPSGDTIRQQVWLGKTPGVFVVQVSTPTRSQSVKVVKQ
ncbi:putative Ig domain-containing protein [Rudanella lutea]|uniref:putative Ig domain-containing protein n=1 Tax=Rudanella lutea TaxID=451374 RepID=UPI0003A424FF|nr:putative Ig domain-containing protein [Rudanella lutea]